jgi:hypothetical protein
MNKEFATEPIEDSVAKVNEEVAVGEDLEFQRKWWRFENVIWVVFTLIIFLDLAGVFGRGPLAKTERHATDGTLDVKYERIERTGTPSMVTLQFGPQAIRNGEVSIYVSQSLVKELGAQRVIPDPKTTTLGNAGLTYTFPVSKLPADVALDLQPVGPGIYDFTIGVVGAQPVNGKVVVVP